MVHECEILCITSADNKLSIPYAVNHLTKAISGEETGKKKSKQPIPMPVCLLHLKNRLINIGKSVIKDTSKCSSSCQGCAERDSMCDVMSRRVYSCVETVFLLLRNELKYIKLAVLCISMDSESRNQTGQDIFKENNLSGEIDSQLTYQGR